MLMAQDKLPDDANSLLRIRSMLDSFTHVTSNVIGSHMLYSLFAGCKFSFCGPIHCYDESILRATGFHSLDQLVNLLSGSYIREKFSKYFVNHPRMGLVDESFAEDSIG